jgi:cytochrome c oxidase subunit 2
LRRRISGFGPALGRGTPLTIGTVLLLALVVAGCGENDQSTLAPKSSASDQIARLWWVMLVASAVIFGVVLVLVFVAVLRRRGTEPASTKGGGLWIPAVGGVAIPIVVLAALFALTLRTLPKTSPVAASATGLTIDVVGRQWFWDVSYPGKDVRTANEVHIPVGVPVNVQVSSADVVHSFWVPELNRKIDMIPGQTNRVTLEADRAGVYRGQCAEFCGLQHAHMAFYVVAEPRAAFEAWLARESKPAALPATPELERGQQVLLGSACVYCHTIDGTTASGKIGPDLTHLASRRSLAAGLIPNSPGYLAGWILDPQHVKPGNKMPATDLSGTELQALLAYLESLK